MGLKSLEIQLSIYDESTFLVDELVPELINSFQGLEHLGFTNDSSPQTLDVWRALKQHKSTLKSFVHHQRDLVSEPGFVHELDIYDLSLKSLESQLRAWQEEPSENPLNHLDLEFFGICCHPCIFTGLVLDSMMTSISLRILHIRQSGVDIKHTPSWGQNVKMRCWKIWDFDDADLAHKDGFEPLAARDLYCHLEEGFEQLCQEAFGPWGIASLELLAFGDFSHDRGYLQTNMVFVRNEEYVRQSDAEDYKRPTMSSERTFRFIRRGDRRQHHLLEKYAYALAACPTESILDPS
ncbi:hypothetical protein IQ07DRAFT_648662 [Pyrenochaeta sp. DS3sAY3a]|nr:hypothetical protein IQ07DRAFT_648662 [Pyrenochaeta sp. DS3sAY3a]